ILLRVQHAAANVDDGKRIINRLIDKVKAQVLEVKGVMMENIEKVLDRGEKIGILVDKTENLRSQVGKFKRLFTFRKKGTKFSESVAVSIVASEIIDGSNNGCSRNSGKTCKTRHRYSSIRNCSTRCHAKRMHLTNRNQTASQPTALDEDAAPKAVNNEALLADIEAEPLVTTAVVTPAEGLAFGKVKLVAVDNEQPNDTLVDAADVADAVFVNKNKGAEAPTCTCYQSLEKMSAILPHPERHQKLLSTLNIFYQQINFKLSIDLKLADQ
ncbi:vesicle-associated membrane protein 722 isoform X2, partial [Tanacetum coccineum]